MLDARSLTPALVAVGLLAVYLVLFAIACGEDDPHITFIGIVDAAPPRLGRPADGGASD